MTSILIVCVGNICRSPLAAALLREALPEHQVTSAGLSALVGHDVDATARKMAVANGATLPQHQARQFTEEIGVASDLILVLEAGHKRELERIVPQLSGRTFLLSHWVGGKDIADPFRRSESFHEEVFFRISDAVASWTERLSQSAKG